MVHAATLPKKDHCVTSTAKGTVPISPKLQLLSSQCLTSESFMKDRPRFLTLILCKCVPLFLINSFCGTKTYYNFSTIGQVAQNLQSQLESGIPQHVAWNNCATDLVQIVKVTCL